MATSGRHWRQAHLLRRALNARRFVPAALTVCRAAEAAGGHGKHGWHLKRCRRTHVQVTRSGHAAARRAALLLHEHGPRGGCGGDLGLSLRSGKLRRALCKERVPRTLIDGHAL